MPNDPLWLPLDEIIKVNRETVALTGEPHFLRDSGLLGSAWARPMQLWHYLPDKPDMPTLAAVLLVGIGRNHAFEQGNHRTALTSAVMFLNLNGLDFEDSADLKKIVRDAVAGRISESQLAAILRSRCKIMTSDSG